MPGMKWLLAQLRSYWRRPRQLAPDPFEGIKLETLVQAHGDWLALFATILEREGVITGDELARSLSEFASQTSLDRPGEGQILSFWALRLQDAAASLRNFPSLH